jgi:diguanylate cyclase (GGDEF)-like protein
MTDMDNGGTWLCPTDQDRRRLLEMERKFARPRAIMYGCIALAFAVSTPWIGLLPLIPLVVTVLLNTAVRPLIPASRRPEWIIGGTVVMAQAWVGMGIAVWGGPHSVFIPLLLVPLVTLPARFSGAGVYAGLALSVAILLVATAGVHPVAFAHDPTLTLIALGAAGGLTAFTHTLMRVEMEHRSDAVLDPLTGLLNRKALAARFDELAQQAAVTGGSVCLVACDLDRFKGVNDRYGHVRGDAVLTDATYLMRAALRSFELVYRLGGEEFLVVLPGATLTEGQVLAERMRVALEDGRPGGLEVTASFGVAAARGADVAFEPLFRAADAALYEAKRSGRNRVVAHGAAVELKRAA